ncbi:hypothetical protein J41TS12_50420 [Paenibacillus antibioticophila]|uniref:Uncharacterized protein n=1 Tax=Paenibacillus antibioticophila TaxID=1274374 RepID=A0A920CH94_9BACL|nr:ATPase [Paenibacillus antibioticophila]GIO40181.1 hypothetical protein J41TS12_50420 [Paenibacillus antibioticophila]
MAKQIRFIRLLLENFAGVKQLDEKYGDITRLSGHNGEGKTTFGEAPAWIFFGTDLFGKTWNPSPTTYEFDVVRARLTLSVDGDEMTFERGIDGGDAVYLVNDVPKTATKFKEAVAALFDKDEFLSLYNPAYFFTMNRFDQRAFILKNTLPPARSIVLAEMSRTSPEQKVKDIPLNPAAAKLEELLKKASIDDLIERHSGKNGLKTKLEKQHLMDKGRVNTLREQFDRLPAAPDDIEAVKAESAALLEQVQLIAPQMDKAKQEADKRSALQAQLTAAQQQVDSAKRRYMAVYNEPIEDTCPRCKRPLDEDSVKTVTDAKEARKKELHAEHTALVAKRKELEEQLAGMELVDVSDLWNEMREMERKRDELEDIIHAESIREGKKAELEAAKKAEDDTLSALKETIFILDAIKSYQAKESEIQAEKIQSQFTTLTVRLFDYVKSKGEYVPDFSIQMHGKDYATLSVGEKITAGLELSEVLFKQSELVLPTFVDGIGEYTGEFMIYGQLITAQAEKGREFTIETEDLSHEKE